ncbi:hypothetical protein DYB32_004144 [Aphanomyces invadans]|uniref:Ribosome biogenesis protein NOP53 n=1 Tax=Aphanomyces invadans TaxID=157072 RepID=A0A3R6WMV0_9STRA|nr:hypothetical protein DYB32_004144 [Aphanomyces invadans]
MARKRKLQTKAQRIKEVGAEIEAFIEEQGEATKLQNYGDEHLFAIDTAGTTSKKAKITKDPAVWSGKFKPEKAKGLKSAIKRIQAKPVVVVSCLQLAFEYSWAYRLVLSDFVAWLTLPQDDEDGEDDETKDNEDKPKLKAKEKLTRSDRNRQARHKALEKQLEHQRANKKLLKQINNVKTLESSVKKDEKVSANKQQLKTLLKKQKLEEEPEVMIAGKKRCDPSKLLGSAMKDRYDSLLKRNKIEIGKTTRNKSKWTKFIPRHKYKDDFSV